MGEVRISRYRNEFRFAPTEVEDRQGCMWVPAASEIHKSELRREL